MSNELDSAMAPSLHPEPWRMISGASVRRPPDWLPIRRFLVQDTSMQPTLQPGDGLLVSRLTLVLGRLRRGDLVVLREPDRQLTFAVKRIAAVDGRGDVMVSADNPNVSRDSREYGAVPRRLVIGKVVYRYLPAHRRGRL